MLPKIHTPKKHKHLSRVFTGLVVYVSALLTLNQSYAQSLVDINPHAKERPKVALVLSGGGARGLAHIGVLRVLKEMHIPIDLVVGTSMGAVIGGAYAAGRSVEEIEDIVRHTSWDSVLADRPARDELDFRRREEDVILPSRIELAITKKYGFTLPPSAAGNAALEQTLSRLIPTGMRNEAVNHLPIPFRSVASDLLTGELVELNDVPLFVAVRASLAVPGVFAPAQIGNRKLVDGGLVRNLPIDMAKKMGADVVIAVNVGTPLAQESELGSAIGVAQQMIQILTEQNVQRSLKELGEKDILIAPNLTGINFLDFAEHHNAMHAGDIATRLKEKNLQQLSIAPDDYARYEQLRTAEVITADKVLRITKIEVQGTQNVNPEILIKQTGLTLNEWASEEKIKQSAMTLYGRGDLDHVEVEIQDKLDDRNVLIKAHEATWSKSRLRVGLELSSDFKDDHRFNLGGLLVQSSLNDWGGEMRFLGKIGSNRILDAQFFQPLDAGSLWYIAPEIESSSSSSDRFDHFTSRRLDRIAYKATAIDFPIGRHLGNWGDIRFGLHRIDAQLRTIIPEDLSKDQRVLQTSEYLNFRRDTIDSLAFPTHGNLFTFNWERALNQDDPKKATLSSSLTGMTAFNNGKWAGHVYGEFARSQGNFAPLSLGGFLHLSGTPTDSVSKKTVAFGRVVFAEKIANMPTTLGGAVRLGFSAEIGGGFEKGETVKFSKFKKAFSSFIAVDTRFGPLYLGSGATHGGASSFYLFLGPIW